MDHEHTHGYSYARVRHELVCSVNIGQELSAAALTRGLCAEKKRTNICRIGFHIQDIAAFVIAVLPAAVMICNRFGVIS